MHAFYAKRKHLSVISPTAENTHTLTYCLSKHSIQLPLSRAAYESILWVTSLTHIFHHGSIIYRRQRHHFFDGVITYHRLTLCWHVEHKIGFLGYNLRGGGCLVDIRFGHIGNAPWGKSSTEISLVNDWSLMRRNDRLVYFWSQFDTNRRVHFNFLVAHSYPKWY